MATVHEFPGCRISLDTQHLPIAISRWEGLLTQEAARAVFAGLETVVADAYGRGEKIWSVVDATTTERPDAVTRKLLADLAADLEARFPGTLQHPSYVAIESSFIRGALTALNWVSGGSLSTQPHASLKSALEAAMRTLQQQNLSVPAGLEPSAYELPAAQSRHA